MSNFSKDFDKRWNETEKSYERGKKWAIAWFIFCAVLSLSLLSGLVFVVYKLLVYFGVL